MSTAYLEPEFLLAGVVADYLRENVSQEIQSAAMIVDFTDPMSIDDANRIIVQVPSGSSDESHAGNGEFEVEIGIKSQWAQASINEDFAAHKARVREVRSWLWSATLAEDLNTAGGDVIGVDFVQPQRGFKSEVYDGWLFTDTTLKVHINLKEPQE